MTYSTGSTHDQRRIGVVQCLSDFYELINAEGQFLSQSARDKLPEIGYLLCNLYAGLSAEAKRANKRLWKWSPKHHLFLHMCEWTGIENGNPRYDECYMDEDAVGRMIEVSHSLHPRSMAGVAIYKWPHWALEE